MTLRSGKEGRKSIDVTAHQILDRLTLIREVRESFIHRSNERLESREVLVMRRSAFHILPQELDWVVVWGVGGQLEDRQACCMCLEEGPCRLAGMIACADLNQDGWVNLTDFNTFQVLFGTVNTNSPPDCP